MDGGGVGDVPQEEVAAWKVERRDAVREGPPTVRGDQLGSGPPRGGGKGKEMRPLFLTARAPLAPPALAPPEQRQDVRVRFLGFGSSVHRLIVQ